ncbi:hypothetical protein N7501_004363, partial [Penicillium viridicatum]
FEGDVVSSAIWQVIGPPFKPSADCNWSRLEVISEVMSLPLVLPGMSSQVIRNQPKPNHKSSNTDFQNQCRQMRTVKVNGASQVPWGRFTPATYNTAIIIAISNNTLHWTSDGSTGILSTLEDLY